MARDFLDANVERIGRLRAAARPSPVSTALLLARHFRASLGTSPYRYQVMRRLDRARHLLQNGASLAEASAISGFADQSHMTRQFRERMASRPGVGSAPQACFKVGPRATRPPDVERASPRRTAFPADSRADAGAGPHPEGDGHAGDRPSRAGLQGAGPVGAVRHQDHLQDHRARCSSTRPPAPARGKRLSSTRSRPATRCSMYETGHFAALWTQHGDQARPAAGVHRASDWRSGADAKAIEARL